MSEPCHLLRVPREIRDMIYQYALRYEYIAFDHHHSDADRRYASHLLDPPLLRTCVQVRREAITLPVRVNELIFRGAKGCNPESLSALNMFSEMLAQIPQLSLHLDWMRHVTLVYCHTYLTYALHRRPEFVIEEIHRISELVHRHPKIHVVFRVDYFGKSMFSIKMHGVSQFFQRFTANEALSPRFSILLSNHPENAVTVA